MATSTLIPMSIRLGANRSYRSGSYCAAFECKNSKSVHRELHFFRFPKEKERCKRWVINCHREDLMKNDAQYININCRLCECHFEPSQFMNPKVRQTLVWNAIPTIKLPQPRKASACRPCNAMTVEPEDPISQSNKLYGGSVLKFHGSLRNGQLEKMEQYNGKVEREEEVQKDLYQGAESFKVESLSTFDIKEEPLDANFDDVDPLSISQEDDYNDNKEEEEEEEEEAIEDIAETTEQSENRGDKDSSSESSSNSRNWLNECPTCGLKIFKKVAFAAHKMKCDKAFRPSSSRPYECNICKRRFTHKHYLGHHMYGKTCLGLSNQINNGRSHGQKTLFKSQTMKYKCLKCGICCATMPGMKSHMDLYHSDKEANKYVLWQYHKSKDITELVHTKKMIKYKCLICRIHCATMESVNIHMESHHLFLKKKQLNFEKTDSRTKLKPIEFVDLNTFTEPKETTGQNINDTFLRLGSNGEPKSYKEYLELQEKMLIDKGMTVKYPKKLASQCSSSVPVTNCIIPTLKEDSNVTAQKHALLTKETQVMILSMQTGGTGGQLILPAHIPVATQMKSALEDR